MTIRLHNSQAGAETVVLVHGVWMTGLDMWLLRRRLRRCGFNVRQFSYPSLRRDIAFNAARLQAFTRTLAGGTVHFVGHSLGGLVILRLFEDFPQQQPGRIVLLGTPYPGSHAARQMEKYTAGRWLLGRSLEGALRGNGPVWRGGRELGVIAGTLPLGGGSWVSALPRPHDGSVCVTETQVPGQTAHICLPVSHMGVLLATSVAREVCLFLKAGRFSADGQIVSF